LPATFNTLGASGSGGAHSRFRVGQRARTEAQRVGPMTHHRRYRSKGKVNSEWRSTWPC